MIEEKEGNEEGNVEETTQLAPPKLKVGKKKSASKLASPRDLLKEVTTVTTAKRGKKTEPGKLDETDPPGTVYYTSCRKGLPRHVGIIYRGRPHGAVQAKDWCSTEKDFDQPWPSQDIPCPVCGTRLPLRKHPHGHLIPMKRFLCRTTETKLKKLMGITKEEVSSDA